MADSRKLVSIVGAGIGGLATAARLAHAGCAVNVFDLGTGPGGKMRTFASPAGPVDAGPTVLTLKPVFDALFHDLGETLSDHVTLKREHIIARHFWTDGTQLDLTADAEETEANIVSAFGSKTAQEFRRFDVECARLFSAFDGPMMQSDKPRVSAQVFTILRSPLLLRALGTGKSLYQVLQSHFTEPRMVQLFARYATYVGGLPVRSPALMKLIWQAEAQGVWHVQGGMHRLAAAIEAVAKDRGAEFHYGARVDQITRQPNLSLHLNGRRVSSDAVVFNGDPRALVQGFLGPDVTDAIPQTATEPRSLSANVWAFAAEADGPALAAHNVFFADDGATEYEPLERGQRQQDPTIYICAQDRFGSSVPHGLERFEIIINAPPVADGTKADPKEKSQWQTQLRTRLEQFGLRLAPPPDASALTLPAEFAALHPGSNGSLYGRSPHGMMAAFKRPTARTNLPGLYLAGGGAHPGAGVPMAALSARHAAVAIMTDLGLTSAHRRAGMRGGTSMGSLTTARVPSRSSGL